jgi:tetratricopeptide (TPR) repeat protein
LRAGNLVAPAAEAETIDTFAAPIISQIYAYTAGAHQHYGLFADADRWAQRAIEFGTKHKIPFAQAIGYEFLGEDAVHAGEYEAGLGYAERELEIVEKLHSRERRAWVHLVVSHCANELGQLERAEREYVKGITLAESVGEQRVTSLLKPNLAVAQARLGRYNEALQTASENLELVGPASLLYSRFEALRCLAEVRFRRALSGLSENGSGSHNKRAESIRTDELDEAERLCAEAAELVSPSESRVSRLWLGPLYIEVLLAQGKRAKAENDNAAAERKYSEAAKMVAAYQELVADCQSPRFTAEASRLAAIFDR